MAVMVRVRLKQFDACHAIRHVQSHSVRFISSHRAKNAQWHPVPILRTDLTYWTKLSTRSLRKLRVVDQVTPIATGSCGSICRPKQPKSPGLIHRLLTVNHLLLRVCAASSAWNGSLLLTAAASAATARILCCSSQSHTVAKFQCVPFTSHRRARTSRNTRSSSNALLSKDSSSAAGANPPFATCA
jgi:hypothetical protein